MKFKFILAIAMILSVFCVLPVNADDNDVYCYVNQGTSQNINIGHAQNVTVYLSGEHLAFSCYLNGVLYSTNTNPNEFILPQNETSIYVSFQGRLNLESNFECGITINYIYGSDKTYDINVDESENIINLGTLTNLNDISLSVGSNQGQLYYIEDVTTTNSTYIGSDVFPNEYYNITIDLNENSNFAEISFNAVCDYGERQTTAKIYYDYYKPSLPSDYIQAFIQTYDYQTGNILSGVNISIYEVTENNDNLQIGNKIFSSISAESQIILMVKNNTEYFIENELIGYYAVKNENIASLNNRYGYLWNPTLNNPLRLYYSKLDPTADYNANFIVQDVNNNGISGVSVTMDNSITKISNSIGGLTFNNVSAGPHTFTFSKTGYQTAQRTIDIQLQYAAFYQTLFKENQIIQPTIQPTGYPTIQPTVQPTLQPIDKPANLADSVKYGLSKIFGVNSLDTINLVFALMLILFPAVIGAVVTNQALGFIAGGMMGFVFALGIGLIPIWIFFAMVMFTVIYLILTHGAGGEF